VYDETPRAAHIQLCTYVEVDRGRPWQCRLTDPHPDVGHKFAIDKQFGRPLHELPAEKLAGLLRDKTALTENLQARIDELSIVAAQVVQHAAFGAPLSDGARRWVAANQPSAAEQMGVRP
jgi:hypothetical protein